VTAGGTDGPDLVTLIPRLYRARFQPFGFTAEVRSREVPAGSDGEPELSPEECSELNGTLVAGPDGRYRGNLVDEEGEPEAWAGGWDELPFGALFAPGHLLPAFDLEITGETRYLGRPACAITGRPRPAASERALRSAGRLAAVADTELGILLRCERTGPRGEVSSAEFTSFAPEVPEAGPPRAGRRPGGTPAELSDEQVNLLYRTSLGPQRFAAELRERADPGTMMRLAAAAAGPESLVRRISWLLDPGDESPPAIDLTARLQVAMPGSYRIDAHGDPGRRPACTSCDGSQLWLVYPDRVVVRAAAPPPAGIPPVIDPAWLLFGYRLTALGIAEHDGRPGLRLTAEPTSQADQWPMVGPLSGQPAAADRIEAVIDTELGIILRQDWYYRGRPVFSTELTGVTGDVDPAAFTVEPGPGVKVVSGGLLAESGMTIGQAASGITKGVTQAAAAVGLRWLTRPRP
jgi:hypothetical protein